MQIKGKITKKCVCRSTKAIFIDYFFEGLKLKRVFWASHRRSNISIFCNKMMYRYKFSVSIFFKRKRKVQFSFSISFPLLRNGGCMRNAEEERRKKQISC
ncbi:hypothetical protein CDL12_22258 [Handroanthus impetiginosus]|uniref:Uncharacterized protein n=1 Tax=Handroanthus impetiginosus TaxID=429701 RepID=A0A2G9GIS3_9LAMI|nr:hypothetical protein CDL12_22258 [Handroanthus impetiginosus]